MIGSPSPPPFVPLFEQKNAEHDIVAKLTIEEAKKRFVGCTRLQIQDQPARSSFIV